LRTATSISRCRSSTNPNLSGAPIRTADFVELQQGINAARAALGWPAMTFSIVAPGGIVQASHIPAGVTPVRAVQAQEIRNVLQ